jgi:hypothetical protein
MLRPILPQTRAPVPPYDEFAERAKAIAKAIPAAFLEGVEDVVIHRGVKRHPQLPDIVTLGECEPSAMAAMTASGIVRSIVHLYHGSFVDLARRDPAFDVDAELEETIRHEVQHHIEDKAGVRTLIDEDDLFEAHARFRADLEVPPGWYRQGERLEPNVWAVDLDLFVELRLRRREFDALRGKTLKMTVLGEPLELELPSDADPEEVFTLEGEGLLADDTADDGEGHGHGHGHSHGPNTGGKRGGEPPPRGEEAEESPPEAGDLHLVPVVR